jgi:hypothetical protein
MRDTDKVHSSLEHRQNILHIGHARRKSLSSQAVAGVRTE